MIEETTHGPGSLDRYLDILANKYRRRLLISLLDHTPQNDARIPPDIHVEDEDLENLKIQMVHRHLPKLEDAGFIIWDRETNEVRKGPRFDEIRALLQLMRDHTDELPADWL
ncbi:MULTISPECIES: helix-turn-helix domain-containing protein [Natrialbaceae]|uniref:helix-turn-helix domain-containing protein n=1 Tax=Natrialbaceae TaxID=1644061 RepID=UPI00207C6792|nr:helix-turn-helix domain-containing protein [Natronococcus sp. CG52]